MGSSVFSNDPATLYGAKYFDVYSGSTALTRFYFRILGDSTGEMGPFYNGRNNWYDDTSGTLEWFAPWYIRGGNYGAGVLTSQFQFARFTGGSDSYRSFRLVLSDHTRR